MKNHEAKGEGERPIFCFSSTSTSSKLQGTSQSCILIALINAKQTMGL